VRSEAEREALDRALTELWKLAEKDAGLKAALETVRRGAPRGGGTGERGAGAERAEQAA
jgi:hypothetical protein